VNGKNIAAFTTAEEESYAKADVPFDLQTALTEQGAIFHAAEPWSASLTYRRKYRDRTKSGFCKVSEKKLWLFWKRKKA
jgi:hypothetical protein